MYTNTHLHTYIYRIEQDIKITSQWIKWNTRKMWDLDKEA